MLSARENIIWRKQSRQHYTIDCVGKDLVRGEKISYSRRQDEKIVIHFPAKKDAVIS
jgi:hypothetical protein